LRHTHGTLLIASGVDTARVFEHLIVPGLLPGVTSPVEARENDRVVPARLRVPPRAPEEERLNPVEASPKKNDQAC
jgi:hypothetical protein